MTDHAEAAVVTADVLTLLWYGQLAIAASIEELALWARANGSPETQANVISALEVLDSNALAITTGILKLRQ